jgi:hypothetical protein
MVYIDPNIDNTFTILKENPVDRNVRISYNGKDIHDVTSGNVPLISIKENSNSTSNGDLYSSTVGITLNGKILTPFAGTTGILGCIQGLRDLFLGTGDNPDTSNPHNQYNGYLKISCGDKIGTGNPGIFNATGVRLINLSIDESGDNWTQGADYTVDLEYNVARSFDLTGKEYYVKSTVDSWNIEPLEDYAYYSMTGVKAPYSSADSKRSMLQERHNPYLLPNKAEDASLQPASNILPNLYLKIENIPQYKVSRKLSAIGLPSNSGLSGTFPAYQNAQKWVLDRLSLAQYSGNSSLIPIHISLEESNNSPKNFLYNHLRTINFSIYDGSYEINESWLAMPINIGYVEDYTISVGSEEGHIKTVKIQGEIKGLIKANNHFASGVSGTVPLSGTNSIQLNEIMTLKSETSGLKYVVPDASNSAGTLTPTMSGSFNTVLSGVKYFNARNAWLYDIKPYLFRRANIVMSSIDRDRKYVDYTTVPRPIPNNPLYCYDRPLNLNPISTSETHDARKGTINYSCEYSNKFKYFPNTLHENITISDTNPVSVVNEAFVLGRRLGPVLQDLGTVTSSRKEISLEVFVVPPTSIQGFFMSHPDCPLYIGGELYTGISGMFNQLKPFGDRPTYVFGSLGERSPLIGDEGNIYIANDTHAWDPTDGVYRRNMTWTYQHCLPQTHTLDQ